MTDEKKNRKRLTVLLVCIALVVLIVILVPTLLLTKKSQSFAESDGLYCFPGVQNRVRRTWGDYVVEIKETMSYNTSCGPGNNFFARDTVSIDEEEGITLEFDRVNNRWTASEVRILLQNDDIFSYGNYSFRVETIEVFDSSGAVVSNELPDDLILGLFTWDPTEDFSVRENFNHEVRACRECWCFVLIW